MAAMMAGLGVRCPLFHSTFPAWMVSAEKSHELRLDEGEMFRTSTIRSRSIASVHFVPEATAGGETSTGL
jgi:hypothetical protein